MALTTDNRVCAVVFPGQGVQKTGMGKDFFDGSNEARQTFEQASESLGMDMARLCFEDQDRLHLTAFAQPAILTVEIAMLRTLQSMADFRPAFFGGHSLGEYTALVAAGVLPFETAVQMVHRRGQLMQEAVAVGEGGMAAVIAGNLDPESIRAALQGLPIDVANINAPDQVVISGMLNRFAEAEDRLRKALGTDPSVRFVKLNVSAPFHSRFMASIHDEYRRALDTAAASFRPSNAPRVLSNFTGGFHADTAEAIIDALVRQLSGPVRWVDNMQALMRKPVTIYEIGPNRPLSAFFRKIGHDCRPVVSLSAATRIFGKEEA